MESFAKAKLIGYSLNKRASTPPIERMVLPYMDLTYLVSGEMHYLYNDEPIILRGGEAILFPQGSVRERLAGDTPVHYASINIRFGDGFSPLASGVIKHAVTPSASIKLELLRDAWHSAGEYSSKICRSMISALYYELIESIAEHKNPSITAIKHYILSNMKSKITLSGIAEAVHLSPEYCSSQFKKHTGKTIIEYVNEEKVASAKRMIIIGEKSLEAIARELGYTEYSYFYRVFKKVSGHTPASYKSSKRTAQ